MIISYNKIKIIIKWKNRTLILIKNLKNKKIKKKKKKKKKKQRKRTYT